MTARPGPLNLITDVGGLFVGNADDPGAATGVTVIRPRARAVAAVAVGGGGPGTRETDALATDTLVDAVDAIVLSGGSVYGLAAADGVASALGAQGQGYALVGRPGVPVSPIVPAAILYDLANGGDKAWGEAPPYRDLGMRALKAVGEQHELGRVGAGYGARAGGGPGGLGSASLVTHDGLAVGALAAVNAHGSVRVPGTNAFWAWPYEQNIPGKGWEFGGARPPQGASFDLDDWGQAKSNPGMQPIMVPRHWRPHQYDAGMRRSERRAHPRRSANALRRWRWRASRARCVPPFAPFDGDVVFCLSTAQLQGQGPRPFLIARLGELAASTLARAIARGVHAAGG
jgi:L-aminopeptidase/D-esterase-like protein